MFPLVSNVSGNAERLVIDNSIFLKIPAFILYYIMLSQWELNSNKRVFSCPPFNIVAKEYRNPKRNQEFTAYVIDAPRWANVIAMTEDKEIVLIRQYRFGTDKFEMEIPGGVIETGEDPLEGIKRELEEETGFTANDWKLIGTVDANPAIQNNRCFTFLAQEIKADGTINFDPEEEIEYELAPLSKVREYISGGIITNTFIIAAFYWLERELGSF